MKNIKFILLIISVSLLFIFISSPAFSANRFWVGPGAGNWNSTANWSGTSGGLPGASVPGIADVAVFDGGSSANCMADINVNVLGFSINATYTGIISWNTNMTATVGATGFSQAGGIFTGNNGNILLNGPFILSGGVFTSTTGTLQVSGGFTNAGGTFNHANGTVSFTAQETISGNTSFYNILFGANGGIFTIAAGTTISSANNVAISGNSSCIINTGTVEIQKDLTLASSSNFINNGGTATFLFDGTGVQNIFSSFSSITIGTNEKKCALPNVEINKLSGTLNLFGLINLNGISWKTTAGAALVNPGTSTVNINSSIVFTGENLTLYIIHIYASDQTITLSPASYQLTSTNNVIINGGGYYLLNTGILAIQGDLTLVNTNTSAINGGNATLLFNGTGIQNINSSASSLNFVCALPNIQINKTSRALNFSGIINFIGTSWNTIAGASLLNAGTSVVNLMQNTTLSGQSIVLYDITVTGNFTFTTISAGVTWTSTHLITLAGGTSWYQINTGTLNAKGDVLVTNTNTSNNVGGNATLLFDGGANQNITGSGIAGAGRLPSVQINKSGGTLTLSGSLISTDNNWNYIAGNVDATTNSSTVDFYRTAVVDGQGTSATMSFNNVIFSGIISLGGNMDVNGDLTIRSGGTNALDVNAANNYQLNVAGNWTNHNSGVATSFNQRNGKVVFDGAGTQALSLALSTDVETFYNLEMRNTGAGLFLNAPVTISNNANFVTGNINSSASNILTVANAATATGASNVSFVSGPVKKTGNQAFVFPTGKNVVYAPVAMSAPAVNTHQFTAEYFQANPNALYDVNSKDASLNHVSQCEYWTLNRTTGTSAVTVNLSWDTRSCGVNILGDLRVAGWDGAQWKDEGNGGTTGTPAAGTVVSSAAVNTFGPFTLASSTAANALPIALLSFSGQCKNNTVALEWSTASEKNNNYFAVERCVNNVNWEIISKTAGAGNSSTVHHYDFLDKDPFDGISYYRLIQIDYNTHFEYSNIIAIENCIKDSNTIRIYPNPATVQLKVALSSQDNKVNSIEIFNASGEKVYHADGYQSVIDISNDPEGLYLIFFNMESKIVTQKFMIHK